MYSLPTGSFERTCCASSNVDTDPMISTSECSIALLQGRGDSKTRPLCRHVCFSFTPSPVLPGRVGVGHPAGEGGSGQLRNTDALHLAPGPTKKKQSLDKQILDLYCLSAGARWKAQDG